MQQFKIIQEKLEQFIRRFYVNALIKGLIIFFAVGILAFLAILALEYFLWLNSTGRLILFYLAITFEVLLFYRLILIPILKLTRISKGIDYNKASQIIGKHFQEVSDKLTNILQLKQEDQDNDLIIASIEQKSKELKPVPFQLAIDFKQNLKYAKFAIIPVLIILAIWISGQGESFSSSYERVVNYKNFYEPPAPFKFVILNKNLNAEEGQSFQLKVSTIGDIVPEEAKIHIGDEAYFLKSTSGNEFVYEFKNVVGNQTFHLTANEVKSKNFNLSALEIPIIEDFKMNLEFPKYTRQKDKSISGTGNAVVPEGTKITWEVKANSTEKIKFQSKDTTQFFKSEGSQFSFDFLSRKTLNYQVSTSNSHFENYENLNYNIKVIKDEYPKIKLSKKQDSIDLDQQYFYGKLTDDYGLTRLKLVYYPINNRDSIQRVQLPVSNSNYSEFTYAFPNNDLNFEPGQAYEYYFQVYDNDQFNGRKSSKSEIFNFRKKTEIEEDAENLDRQKKSIEKLSEELKKKKEDKKEFKDLKNLQKQNSKLNYSEKQKLEKFVKRQKQQMQIMKDYNKQLKEDLKNLDEKSEDKEKEQLEERLEKNQEQLDKNKELLDELDKLREKIDQEELNEKLDEYENESEKQEKNLEQLLELTKRYYVEKKTEKLAQQLDKLSKKQDDLSKAEENNSEKQDELNKEFQELKEELENLEKKNQELESPMEIGKDEDLEKEVEESQSEAKEKLEDSEEEENSEKEQQNSKSDAQNKQQNAAKKMKEMSQKMQQSMMAGGMEQTAEDAEMLRQILENLITFSIQQEELMNEFEGISNSNPSYANKLRRQAELRENFKHVDDSLYALAMRTPMITESVNNRISDINFNIEKTLERLAENEVRLGTSNQQYTMMYANELANMLDGALDQMQMQMSASGSGKGKSGKGKSGDKPGDQLSDIIKSHEELQKQMQGQGKKGKGEKPGEGEKSGGNQSGGQSGKSSEGESGKQGENGESSKGENGNSGSNGGDGNSGKDGEEGSKMGDSEQMSGEIYEIYKKQQELRNQLENEIKRLGLDADSRNLNKSLDKLEQELLMKGFSSEVLKQMENVKHQLLKLEEAANRQGQDSKRQAETNRKEFIPNQKDWEEKAKEYFNTTEILNRQQLPLQPEYKQLIKKYFNGENN
ncbi:DUF4175 family protein [Psychroflexus aestuariivivens]|uniref:DUF4175 family protein n=1 Tax=Psychroflexus aestuariivivens TaxID=1795040 RepID=UPI000FD92E59|nr:DUF4175 family protein [Psychroflexus aestuariivivens]